MKQRWRPVLNTTDEWIPGGACMQIYQADVVERELVYLVQKPDEIAESQQNAATLILNSNLAIPPYNPSYKQGYGRGTQDWPAQAIIDMAADPGGGANNVPGTPGEGWGPKAGEWFLYRHRDAFSYVAQDGSYVPAAQGAGASYRRLMVAPGAEWFFGASYQGANARMSANIFTSVPKNGGKLGWSYGGLDDGAWVIITQGTTPYHSAFYSNSGYTDWIIQNGSGATGWPFCPIGGMYEWSFHASATGYATEQGEQITIAPYLDDVRLDSECFRTVNIEVDNYGNQVMWTCENMAMGGRFYASGGETLNFRNMSTTLDINVLSAYCHLKKIRGTPTTNNY